MPKTVLVVDDEPTLRDVVADVLRMDGYRVVTAGDGLGALSVFREAAPNLIVLDLMLPGMDGFEVARQVREESVVPIIVLSARDSDIDKIRGFRLQVDDYVTKPFSPLELLMRVKAVLRRSGGVSLEDEEKLKVTLGDLSLDRVRRHVSWNGERVSLTAAEFNVLWALATHPDQVLTRAQLVDEGWAVAEGGEPDSVTVLISRIRNKLEPDPANPRLIQTVRGVGYRLVRP
ncbi:MAG: response regulator [Symbiobacteriia bacterium]